MTEQRPRVRRPIPAALVVARRAMVVASAAMVIAALAVVGATVVAAAARVIAALAVVIALLGEPESDPADAAALEQARDDAAAAREEADAATSIADAAIVIAEEAAAKAAAAEAALADASAPPGETVDPEVIARLEAQLEEARNLAATALVAADAAAGAIAAETAPADGAVSGDAPESGDGAVEAEELPAPEETASEGPGGDAPAPEPDDPAAGEATVTLPGEPFEYGPDAGAALFVVGLPYDDVLNVRDAPAGDVVATLDPEPGNGRAPRVIVRDASGSIAGEPDLSSALTATGLSRQLRTTVWYQLEAAGVAGWSSAAYLAQLGSAEDVTSEVLAELGDNLTADTMPDLALRVAETAGSQEPSSRVVVTSAGGAHENVFTIGVDVLGLADDSLLGYRLRISADPAGNWIQDTDPGPYTLTHVTRTPMCRRGVSDDGLCL